MIRITRQADYAVALLTEMARLSTLSGSTSETFSARDMAEALSLPLPMVSKILKQLARAELLVSHRGVKGGYSLSRDPQGISVGEIVVAVDGPIALTDCLTDSRGSCEQETFCSVRGNWHHINQAIRVALQSVSLAQMTEPFAGPLPESKPLELDDPRTPDEAGEPVEIINSSESNPLDLPSNKERQDV